MSEKPDKKPGDTETKRGFLERYLDRIEWLGNKLPDPAVLFVIGLFVTWGLSAWLSTVSFQETRPGQTEPIKIVNMLTLDKFADFMAGMVKEFTDFPPLGVVLVALLGVGIAEHSGFINACLKKLLGITPVSLLTPMLIFVAIISHTAADAGYVLVIPIGGVMFYAAGRHPLAGIAAGFAGVSGGFSANFIPSGLDPLLSGLTEAGAAVANDGYGVNPLCNWFFTSASCLVIVAVGWFLTDKVVEPRLRKTEVDGDPEEMPKMEELSARDERAMWFGLISIAVSCGLLAAWGWSGSSSLRDGDGSLTSYTVVVNDFGIDSFYTNGEKEAEQEKIKKDAEAGKNTKATVPDRNFDEIAMVKYLTNGGPADKAGVQRQDVLKKINDTEIATVAEANKAMRAAGSGGQSTFVVERNGQSMSFNLKPGKKKLPGARLMKMIVPLIFLVFVVPGLVYGFMSGSFSSHRDVVKGMAKSMETMGYYLVLVFFAALFIAAFKGSGIGDLLAIKGANFIKESNAPPWLTIICIILLVAMVNLLIGSASAKWAMLAPILVPMLMYSGLSPELTQAAYRIGDSSTNIITPMMPYFPLVVVFCQRYVKKTGIGTVAAMMLPYSITFLVCWSVFLIIYWMLGIPLGLQATYEYVSPT